MFNLTQTELSQYANSPRILAIINAWNIAIDPAVNLETFYSYVWNLDSAQGFGLTNWGAILGVSRYLQIPSSQKYFGFSGALGTPFGSAPFYSGGSFENLYYLPDPAYKQLLIAKAFANVSRCSLQNCNTLAQTVFGSGAMCTLDLGDMAWAYVFNGIPTSLNLAIAQNSGVFPHPTGVQTTYRSGLIYNAQLVAETSGSDTGYGSGFGTLSQTTDANGNTITSLYTASGDVVLTITSSSTLGSTYFNDLTINGVSLAASNATFSSSGSSYTWTWTSESALAFVSGTTYTILVS